MMDSKYPIKKTFCSNLLATLVYFVKDAMNTMTLVSTLSHQVLPYTVTIKGNCPIFPRHCSYMNSPVYFKKHPQVGSILINTIDYR